MTDAMEAVRQGEMSINQAAIHFNVPYSSLYNRIKRIKAAEEAGTEGYDAALAAEGGPPPDDGDVYVSSPFFYIHIHFHMLSVAGSNHTFMNKKQLHPDRYEDDLDEDDPMMIAASGGGGGASGGITPSPTAQQQQQHSSGALSGGGSDQHSSAPTPSSSSSYASVVPAYLAAHVPVMTLPGVMTGTGAVVPLSMDSYQAYAQQQQQQHSSTASASSSSTAGGNSSGQQQPQQQPSGAATYQQ